MKTVKILFQGDSVTDEERDRNDPHHLGKGYAKFVAQRLKEVALPFNRILYAL